MALKFTIKGPPPFFWFFKSQVPIGGPYSVAKKAVYVSGVADADVYTAGMHAGQVKPEERYEQTTD